MSPRRGFTLIEIVVGIAIIGILASLLLPAVLAAREAARRTQCKNNLKQFGTAFHSYHDVNSQFPPPYVAVRNAILPWFLGIRGQYDDANIHTYGEFLLPYLEETAIAGRIDYTQPYFAPANLSSIGLPDYLGNNQRIVSVPLSVFVCPSSPTRSQNPFSFVWNDLGVPITYKAAANDYGPSSGVNGPLVALAPAENGGIENGVMSNNNPRTKFRDITDGTTQTALMWEIAARPSIYELGHRVSGTTAGGGWADVSNAENWFRGSSIDGSTAGGPCAINCTNRAESGVYSFHPGGVYLLLTDASVRFLSENTQISTFVALVTSQGGTYVEALDDP
jgi:prepilin-type N-terminal cleavage/methylation domain-containing protein